MHSDFPDRLPELIKKVLVSPQIFIHEIDRLGEHGLAIETDREFFSRAIFLDQRALSRATQGAWMPLSGLKDRVLETADKPPVTHFIFHIGHCGSTLISRLLEAVGGNLPLREPLVLRTLSDLWRAAESGRGPKGTTSVKRELEFHGRLLGRRFSASEVPIIKVTSFASSLGPPLLALNPANRALLMAMSEADYLATLLGAEEYEEELRDFAPARLQTLTSKVGPLGFEIGDLSHGQLAGLAWSSEVVSLSEIIEKAPSQALFVDFDRFLAAPQDHLRKLGGFFGLTLGEADILGLLEGPVLRQYSKSPKHPFDAAARRERIAEARTRAADQIGAGQKFAAELRGRYPVLATAASRLGYA